MRRLRPGVHLLLTHISRMSVEYASKLSPRQFFRAGDLAYWTSPRSAASAAERGITFTGYRELARLQTRVWV